MNAAERAFYDADEYHSGEYVESDTHVPTTEAVRASYATNYYMIEVGSLGTVLGRAAAFDRWVAQVEREAAAKALEDLTVEPTTSRRNVELIERAAEYREGKR